MPVLRGSRPMLNSGRPKISRSEEAEGGLTWQLAMTQAESPHHFVSKSIHAINDRKVTLEKSLILFKTPGVFLSTSKRPPSRFGVAYWTGNLACCSPPRGWDEKRLSGFISV
jgi:hypothetical protein